MTTLLRPAREDERGTILQLIRSAFGGAAGAEIATLVDALLDDPTASPMLSFVAILDNAVVGHVLFTNAPVAGAAAALHGAILAPLAVAPAAQNRGIGGRLIAAGLAQLCAAGTELVFVLGYPAYYQRHGFSPAGAHGFVAPYPIPPENADAWMVQAQRPGALVCRGGRVRGAAALDDVRYWVE